MVPRFLPAPAEPPLEPAGPLRQRRSVQADLAMICSAMFRGTGS
jgi:hypothetical protein